MRCLVHSPYEAYASCGVITWWTPDSASESCNNDHNVYVDSRTDRIYVRNENGYKQNHFPEKYEMFLYAANWGAWVTGRFDLVLLWCAHYLQTIIIQNKIDGCFLFGLIFVSVEANGFFNNTIQSLLVPILVKILLFLAS